VSDSDVWDQIMNNSIISNNTFYNIEYRAFYFGESIALTINNNLFKNIGADTNGYYGIIDRVKNDCSFSNNIITNTTPQSDEFLNVWGPDTIENNQIFGELNQGLSGFNYLSEDPTDNYIDFDFLTDTYTNSPQTITVPKITNPAIDVASNNQNKDVIIFPNPTSGKIKIKSVNLYKITIFDINGRKIIVTKQKEIDLSLFKKGIYLIRINTNLGRIINKKLCLI
jgi:hypothetical protein